MVVPPFSYYGGKTRMAQKIVDLLPDNADTYVEPFAGSLAVLLRKQPHKCEVVNDMDGRIVSFWRTLRDKPEELAEALRLTPYARDEFKHALATIDNTKDEVEYARKVYVILRMSRRRTTSGSVSDFRGAGDANGPAYSYRRSVDAIAQAAERLRGVIVENTDAISLVRRWDKRNVAMYLDPPYVGETRTARNYTVENAGIAFHRSLVSTVNQMSAKILISGYDHPIYEGLHGWRKIEFKSRTGSSSEATRYATEVLWANY